MREVKRITINDGETPLEFEITPMSALQAERWMLRAAFALGSGMSAITKKATAQEIVQSLSCVDFEKVAPLWEELLTCCQIKQGGAYLPLDPRTVEGKIDYPTTIFLLKVAAVEATFGFFGNGGFANFLTSMRGVLNS